MAGRKRLEEWKWLGGRRQEEKEKGWGPGSEGWGMGKGRWQLNRWEKDYEGVIGNRRNKTLTTLVSNSVHGLYYVNRRGGGGRGRPFLCSATDWAVRRSFFLAIQGTSLTILELTNFLQWFLRGNLPASMLEGAAHYMDTSVGHG